jgi:hypothetical protein
MIENHKTQSQVGDTLAAEHWTACHSKPIIFVILTCVGVGIYLAFTIPIAVFPSTDFPRVIIGVDNGVLPCNSGREPDHHRDRRDGSNPSCAGSCGRHPADAIATPIGCEPGMAQPTPFLIEVYSQSASQEA